MLGIGLFALPAGIISAAMLEAEAGEREERAGPTSPASGEFCLHCGHPLPADRDAG